MSPRAENHQGLHGQLKEQMCAVGRDLTESMQKLVQALEQRDAASENRILDRIKDLPEREDALKEICLRILASKNGNTPELRWTGYAHRVLSLMGKSSVEIATIAKQIGKIQGRPELPIARDLPRMGRLALEMLEQSIRTALHPNVEDARKIIEEDSLLDEHKDDFAKRAITFVTDNPDSSQPLVPYVIVSRHLERIGDHASHIAEEVVYYLQAA